MSILLPRWYGGQDASLSSRIPRLRSQRPIVLGLASRMLFRHRNNIRRRYLNVRCVWMSRRSRSPHGGSVVLRHPVAVPLCHRAPIRLRCLGHGGFPRHHLHRQRHRSYGRSAVSEVDGICCHRPTSSGLLGPSLRRWSQFQTEQGATTLSQEASVVHMPCDEQRLMYSV